jgi:tRNA (cytidine/uridine-2'-O-)-methyltransferase
MAQREAQVTPPWLRVVLHEPEIPNNTGNIGRSCVAVGAALHLVKPLGFDTSEKACRRAGLDYWPRLGVREHENFDAFLADTPPAPIWLFSSKGRRPYFDAPLRAGDSLVFGKESAGLPDHLLERYPDRVLVLPMVPHERSLNLATAVCAVLYEAVRQEVERKTLTLDELGRLRIPRSITE